MNDHFICLYDGQRYPMSSKSDEHIVPETLGGLETVGPVSKFWNQFFSISFERPFLHSEFGKDLKNAAFGPPPGCEEVVVGRIEYEGITHLRLMKLVDGAWQHQLIRKPGAHFTDSVVVHLVDKAGEEHQFRMSLPFEYLSMNIGDDDSQNVLRVVGEEGTQKVLNYLEKIHSGEIPRSQQRGFWDFVEENDLTLKTPEPRIEKIEPSDRVDLLRDFPIPADVRHDLVGKLLAKVAVCYAAYGISHEFVQESSDCQVLLRYLKADLISGKIKQRVVRARRDCPVIAEATRQVNCGDRMTLLWNPRYGVGEIESDLRKSVVAADLVDSLKDVNGMRRVLRNYASRRIEFLPSVVEGDILFHRIEVRVESAQIWVYVSLFGGVVSARVRVSSDSPALIPAPLVRRISTNWGKNGGPMPNTGRFESSLVPAD